jgi:hypothetical protein
MAPDNSGKLFTIAMRFDVCRLDSVFHLPGAPCVFPQHLFVNKVVDDDYICAGDLFLSQLLCRLAANQIHKLVGSLSQPSAQYSDCRAASDHLRQ